MYHLISRTLCLTSVSGILCLAACALPSAQPPGNLDTPAPLAFMEPPAKHNHYVRLLGLNHLDEVKTASTGIAISDSQALVCFHSYKDVTKVLAQNAYGTMVKGQQVHCQTDRDLMIMDFGRNAFIPPPLRFAAPQVGEMLYSYTNSLGANKMFFIVMVTQISQYTFVFTPGIPPGASGSAMYNGRGEIVGMVQGIILEAKPPLGVALHAYQLIEAIKDSKTKAIRYF